MLGRVQAGMEEAAKAAADGGAAAKAPGTVAADSPGGRAPVAAGAAPDASSTAAPVVTGTRAIQWDERDCDRVEVNPRWLEPALRDACRRAQQDGGRALGHAFVANIPKMMFVFLPLMAAVMLLLYWRPRRYYVEHLVFYLHVHAALFLALTVLVVVGAAASVVPPLEAVTAVLGFATFVYSGWYVWRAMRVHYGNGRALTVAKFAFVAFCYVVFLAFSVAGTALVSAVTA
jgi:hypothetical protein